MNIGIDHGYYAIKTRHFSFPAGIAEYSHEPYTLQNTLEFGGKFYVCGTGRQPILRNKMENDNYYLLTLVAIAKEIKQRGGKTECSVRIAAGLPLAGFGREKKSFREYLLRSSQLADGLRPVCFQFEGIAYKITIEDVKLFPQGYSAIALHPELIQNEPSVLLMDIGGWTVDLMRLDNGVPNAATCRSLELGMIRCIDETKEQVRRDTGLSVTDAQVERVLAGKPCSMDEDARNITLTTESTAVLIPFRAQEIMQTGGIYYGQNAVSKNMIVADRRKLLNGNSFRLGVSGSGKSFSAKEEIVSIALSTNDDILILDPESEFGFLVEALGGEIIRISAASNTHLNALDMDKAYGDERNPLIEKSEFILSLFEQLVGAGGVSAKEKSILDRCTYDVYREYMANNYEGEAPTLKDLYHSLLKQPEPEARGLALSSELFITGSLNTFAQHTNVDTKARIIAYDIRELGEQLMPIGMLVTLDAIFNRVIQNWKKGKTTWVFADEFYLLFRYQYSADFFYKLWKRIRKYNGLVTGLTQNVEELLRSDTARLMLANSEFLLLLNQSSTDRDELANLLHISDTQLGYITNVSAGCGLIRCAGNIVPFENSFPRNTRLYQLMTTKPDEALRGV